MFLHRACRPTRASRAREILDDEIVGRNRAMPAMMRRQRKIQHCVAPGAITGGHVFDDFLVGLAHMAVGVDDTRCVDFSLLLHEIVQRFCRTRCDELSIRCRCTIHSEHPAKAQRRKVRNRCHFDCKENRFSLPLGMTSLGRYFAPLQEIRRFACRGVALGQLPGQTLVSHRQS